ncbi:MAG: Ribosomal RNA large subunit methyltransferase I [Verrucomicrobia bacterium ADurb.Bin118]|jgi:23S rRNA (cytosine1962-C5)-methyltransferase|nr:class I SAM-dependent methyltransferase [Verrucomicrobiota bacterium]OQB94760.1 MAG: Ribosomal RNA large subunit methyltransferase I [Verrucomicrobia bacterium ADurb.Bin118]
MGHNAEKSRTPEVTTRLRLHITTAAEARVRAGHPWVFAESVREQNRNGFTGELAVIYDRHNKFLAVGLFDADSPIRVRVLHRGKPQTIDPAWWTARLAAAVGRRAELFDARTTGYRLINGESDGWPGLVLDRYGAALVLKIYTAAWLPGLKEIATLIRTRLRPERIVLRTSRNVQRTSESRRPRGPDRLRSRQPADEASSAHLAAGGHRHDLQDGRMLFGSKPRKQPTFLENGLWFEADVLHGQKTGFFLDQRENRRLVETLARGRSVLNAFSFSGGFSLYAARGGARSVADLDISAHALEAASRNFDLNQLEPAVAACPHELVQADAFAWLAANPRRQFDLIILDPPSLAKREVERPGAIRAYARLAKLGAARLSPGGLLLACSCSAHVSAEEFFRSVWQGAAETGRRFTGLRTTRHPPDHPAGFKEAEYLKAIYLSEG